MKVLKISAAIVAVLVAFAPLAEAASGDGVTITNEGAFVQQFGNQAKNLSSGVYLLSRPGGQSLRVAFGTRGLSYERALVEQEIAQLDREKNASPEKTERRERLMQDLAALAPQPVMSTDAAKSVIQCGVLYSTVANAGGDFAYSSANASASVAPDGFGPPNPYARDLRVTSKAYSVPSGWIYGPTRTLSTYSGSVSTSAGNAGPDWCTYSKATSQVTIRGCGSPQVALVTSTWDPCGLISPTGDRGNQ